jgi:eukaryotic-like serine/threonine-protein kinase
VIDRSTGLCDNYGFVPRRSLILMSAADDRDRPPSATRSHAIELGSTAPLMAAIVAMSALGSFGAVRAWYPRVHRPTAAPARAIGAAPAPVAPDIDAPRRIAPAAPSGRLSVVTDPAGARVEIDGQPRGVSPVAIDGLSVSEHRIRVTADERTIERTVTVADGVVTEVVFSLPRQTAPIAGWVAVMAPFPVDLVERGEVVGSSGVAKVMLAAGPHDVVLRNADLGFEVTRTIDVPPGRVVSLAIDPPKGLLNVNARPWADVLIDGQMMGQTPLANVAVPLGSHEITFRHPQLGERTERIIVTRRGVGKVAVDLTRPEAERR